MNILLQFLVYYDSHGVISVAQSGYTRKGYMGQSHCPGACLTLTVPTCSNRMRPVIHTHMRLAYICVCVCMCVYHRPHSVFTFRLVFLSTDFSCVALGPRGFQSTWLLVRVASIPRGFQSQDSKSRGFESTWLLVRLPFSSPCFFRLPSIYGDETL